MNNLMIFEGHEVEAFTLNGQVLFNPYHVGMCLDLAAGTVKDHMSKMNDKQVIRVRNSDVGLTNFRKLNNAGENFLTESGVFKLIFRSRKPNAEAFSDWVTDEVLPALRKNGTYSVSTSYQYPLPAATFESVANLGRLIERVMRNEGACPHEIAMVLKPVFQQAGIEIRECFVKIPAYEQLSLDVVMR